MVKYSFAADYKNSVIQFVEYWNSGTLYVILLTTFIALFTAEPKRGRGGRSTMHYRSNSKYTMVPLQHGWYSLKYPHDSLSFLNSKAHLCSTFHQPGLTSHVWCKTGPKADHFILFHVDIHEGNFSPRNYTFRMTSKLVTYLASMIKV